MRFVFLDIECANCFDNLGKIYSIGYLVADENLNIIKQVTDVLINPNIEAWDRYVVKNILAYSIKYVESKPTFEKSYEKIYQLLCDEQTIMCGFGVVNDVRYLLQECSRYSLKPFKLKFLDVMALAELYKEKGEENSLFKAYIKWCNNVPSNSHRSDADAKHTFEIAKQICEKTKKDLYSYYVENSSLSGCTDEFSINFNGEKINALHKKSENSFRKLKAGEEDYILNGSKNKLLFTRFLNSQVIVENERSYFNNKKVALSSNYEQCNFTNMVKLVSQLNLNGATYINKASEADVFVKLASESEKECRRLNYVLNENKKGGQIEIISFDEMLVKLNLTSEAFEKLPKQDLEYLFTEKKDTDT